MCLHTKRETYRQEVSLKERKRDLCFLPVVQPLKCYFVHRFPICHCATWYQQVSFYCWQPFCTLMLNTQFDKVGHTVLVSRYNYFICTDVFLLCLIGQVISTRDGRNVQKIVMDDNKKYLFEPKHVVVLKYIQYILTASASSSPDISLLPPIGPYCNRTWDGWLCWADSFPGDVMQMCPNYFTDFDPSGKGHTHKLKIPFYLLKCTYSISIKHCLVLLLFAIWKNVRFKCPKKVVCVKGLFYTVNPMEIIMCWKYSVPWPKALTRSFSFF